MARQLLSELHKTFVLTGSIPNLSIPGLGSEAALETALSEDSSVEEIRGASIYLLFAKPEKSLKYVGKILRTASFERLREFIVELLTKFGTQEHLEAIILLLRRGSIMDRRKLLDVLASPGQTNDPKALKLIKRYLRYGDQHSKLIAVQAVERIGDAGDFAEDLIYLLQKETAEPVRLAVLNALRKNSDSTVVELLKFVAENDISQSVRGEAQEVMKSVVSGPWEY